VTPAKASDSRMLDFKMPIREQLRTQDKVDQSSEANFKRAIPAAPKRGAWLIESTPLWGGSPTLRFLGCARRSVFESVRLARRNTSVFV
jgi:hypothetical protein